MELAERLSRDLEGTFLELVNEHQDLVYGLARQLTRRDADAQDVAQEAFVRAYHALRRYPSARIAELRLRPWLARIALNAGRNHLRAERAQRPLEALDGQRAEPHAAEEPLRLAERREETTFWLGLLAALPPRYRLAVALRHVEDLSYAELAEALGRPVGTVKSDVHRGVRLLRAAYEAELKLIDREAV